MLFVSRGGGCQRDGWNGRKSMKFWQSSVRFLALVLTLIGAVPMASAGTLFNYSDQSHAYCPLGGRMYWGIFGYWCEDSLLAGVRPIDCKDGPGQPVGTWNNGSMTPEQLCTQPGSKAVYGRTGL
jgi:hypothetical protein